MNDADLCFASLTETAERLRRRELSPLELTRAQLARIHARNADLNAYLVVLEESALAEARAAEEEIAAGRWRGRLHGVPIGVKDLCDVAGVPTTCASRVLDPRPAPRDAGVVRRLREAGAVIVGKLHQTEFALSGYHPDLPVPVNPWDPTRFPGVSSSGSGVATAAGLAFGTLGTDTGGSIRFPSAACGVVGLKPTRGRVSRAGVFPLGASLDHVGPIARSVADAAALLDAIAGPDPDDPTALRGPSPDCVAALEGGARGVRIGVDEAYATEDVESAVAEAFRADVKRLEAAGATLVPVRMPSVAPLLADWAVICAAEAVAHHRGLFPERAASYGPTFRSFLEFGSRLPGAEVARAWIAREEWNARFAALLESIDALACPSMPALPLPVAALSPHAPFSPDVAPILRFTGPFNFSGSPTLSVPSGLTPEGLPLSLQLVGRHGGEATLCRVGRAFEAMDARPRPRPPLA
ncbi:MAG TPA: amidase [Myxococcota bacterium]|nr:amidase [Myxococcota bacterium]